MVHLLLVVCLLARVYRCPLPATRLHMVMDPDVLLVVQALAPNVLPIAAGAYAFYSMESKVSAQIKAIDKSTKAQIEAQEKSTKAQIEAISTSADNQARLTEAMLKDFERKLDKLEKLVESNKKSSDAQYRLLQESLAEMFNRTSTYRV
jgi:Cft2 family RNA processing exonuclease